MSVSYNAANVPGDLIVSDPNHWVFTNTGVAAGQRLPGLLGYEVDATNSFSIFAVKSFTAVRGAPSMPEKNCSLNRSTVIGWPNLR